MLFWNFVLIFILVALNAFFVSVEFAAVARVAPVSSCWQSSGNSSAKIVKSWLENPATRDDLIAASQLGITIVSLALGAVGENAFEAVLEPYFAKLSISANFQFLAPVLAVLPLVTSLVIVTSIHVVLGEQVPKVATLHQPEKMALIAAKPMQTFTRVFKWFIDLLDWATRHILSLMGIKMVGEHSVVYTVEEIKQILDDSEEGGVIQSPEHEMLHAIFDLGDLLVRQVMIPRTEIQAVEADTPLEELVQLVSSTAYTKFPVYEDNLDQIIGILHVKDIIRILSAPKFRAVYGADGGARGHFCA